MKAVELFVVVVIVTMLSGCGTSELPANHGSVESRLFVGGGTDQPLIVGLGGSEGGNAWDSDRWKKTRDHFVDEGYAFLAIGYFGAKGTPEQLDRIALEGIHDAIVNAAKDPKIDANRVAVIGGSKGSELALLLASHYSDIKCVVAIVPSHVTFPALTFAASTSSWTFQGEEVPYVPMPWSAVPSVMKRDLRSAFEIMLEDQEAVDKALIQVEQINGPILLVSAKQDEMWPSTEMSALIMNRLEEKQFPFVHEHIAIEGGHVEPLDHFNAIFKFIEDNFPSHTR